MKHNARITYLAGGVLTALLMLGGCDSGEGPAEQAGEEIDEAADQAGDTANEAAESAGDAVEGAVDEAEDATN